MVLRKLNGVAGWPTASPKWHLKVKRKSNFLCRPHKSALGVRLVRFSHVPWPTAGLAILQASFGSSRIFDRGSHINDLESQPGLAVFAPCWTRFFDPTPSTLARSPSQAPSKLSSTHLANIMENLNANTVAAGSTSHTSTPDDISVNSSPSSLRLYTHSVPLFDIPPC